MRSYLTKLGHYARLAGHELVIVAPGARDETVEDEGAVIERYSSPHMPYDATYHIPLKLGRMRELVRRHSPDVLQVSSPFVPAWVAGTLDQEALPPGAIRAYVYHSDPIGCYLKPWATRNIPTFLQAAALAPAWAWMRKVSRTHDMTVVAGRWLKDELTKNGCPNVINVDFGIEHEDFGPDRADPSLRRRFLGDLSESPDARLLVIAGRLAFDKRQMRLIEAARRLAIDRPLALVVLGDGPERTRLMEAAGDIPQAHFLKFTKDRAEYASILATADVLLHGSPCETYGFVLAETLASGTPFVVPNAGGAAALARPEYSETYPPHAGADAVIEALSRLLARPGDELSRRARAAGLAQPHTRDHFENLFRVYEERLEERCLG